VQSYLQAIRLAGESGSIVMIHCEDHTLVEDATARLVAADKAAIRYFEESRPLVAEVVAVQRAIAFAEATGTPVYIVHLSSARALNACIEAQARQVPVYVETRPLYLHLTRERYAELDGAKYLGCPPLRRQEDLEALWTGIRQGVVHTVCTDHAPWSLAAKLDPGHSILNIRAGVADLQTMLPMLYSEGVRTGRISLARFVQVTSSNTAKLFGLFPRKGTIAVGSDADLVVFDPNLTLSIEHSMFKSNSDYSVYDDWQVTGWPVVTLRRGEIVFRDSDILGKPGTGRMVARSATMPL
jgi:dihydropyrimidinase